MTTSITQKLLKVLVFLFTTEDSSPAAGGGRAASFYSGSTRPGKETAKALFWMMLSILFAFMMSLL